MDFFEHQARARRKTGLLVVYFVVAVALIIVAVYLAVAGVLFYGQSRFGEQSQTLWFPDVFAVVAGATLVIVAVGSLYKMAELSGGGETVARALGGRRINPNTTILSERVLLNVVEEMAIASGTPVPPVFLMANEQAINAFAAGTTPQNAVIGVTRGTIESLKRDELQGVIAHEFSHILNGDMRLNLRLIGVLNGILVIAMIGYVLMRTGSRSYFSSKKGGNPLPLLGLLLYIIGYVGVFFGHLIKSGVSRQREFLADASAVQFTRLPDGIAGALKKIGGLVYGSKLVTARAEEASHMFFGNGLRQPFVQLLATHPPLEERIRRIEPRFDGRFPHVEHVHFTSDDLVDPQTLQARRAAGGSAHAAAIAGAQSFAQHPATAVAQVGEPRMEHVEYATAVVGALPIEVAAAVRDPLGAVATVYALLLDDDEADVRRMQLEYLAARADPRATAETRRIAPYVTGLPAESRLPLVALALPALEGLSERQRGAFGEDVLTLIKADKKVSLFEYAVHRLILKRLVERLTPRRPRPAVPPSQDRLAPAVGSLLSTLAHWGTADENQASRAFAAAVAKLPRGVRIELLPRTKCGLTALDAALDQLAFAPLTVKKSVLEASAASISYDGRATVEEAELLRVISDALDCPMPPLVNVPRTT
jgi:Zn-dependent protease with chaperone function